MAGLFCLFGDRGQTNATKFIFAAPLRSQLEIFFQLRHTRPLKGEADTWLGRTAASSNRVAKQVCFYNNLKTRCICPEENTEASVRGKKGQTALSKSQRPAVAPRIRRDRSSDPRQTSAPLVKAHSRLGQLDKPRTSIEG